jgi:hypothetical protein
MILSRSSTGTMILPRTLADNSGVWFRGGWFSRYPKSSHAMIIISEEILLDHYQRHQNTIASILYFVLHEEAILEKRVLARPQAHILGNVGCLCDRHESLDYIADIANQLYYA